MYAAEIHHLLIFPWSVIGLASMRLGRVTSSGVPRDVIESRSELENAPWDLEPLNFGMERLLLCISSI